MSDTSATVIRDHFNDLAVRWGDDVRASDWSSGKSQELRFTALLELGDFEGTRILDIGCGRGDFLDFLSARDISVRYTGVDLSEDVIAIARQHHPNVDFQVCDVLGSELPRVDYVIASGVHTIDTGDNEVRLQEVLRRLWELAERGVGTNMLSSERPAGVELAPHTYAYTPDTVEAFARGLTPHVRLIRGYLPHDFTVLLNR